MITLEQATVLKQTLEHILDVNDSLTKSLIIHGKLTDAIAIINAAIANPNRDFDGLLVYRVDPRNYEMLYDYDLLTNVDWMEIAENLTNNDYLMSAIAEEESDMVHEILGARSTGEGD